MVIKNTPLQNLSKYQLARKILLLNILPLIDSLMYNKIIKYSTVHDSYSAEVAPNTLKSFALENILQWYSVGNELKFYVNDLTQKYLLYIQCVAWSCNDFSTAPFTDYVNNPIMQIIQSFKSHLMRIAIFKSDKQIHLDLHIGKVYTNKLEKLRRGDSNLVLKIEIKNVLQFTGWIFYLFTIRGLTISYKTYTIVKRR